MTLDTKNLSEPLTATILEINFVTPWCSIYHHCITSFNKSTHSVLWRVYFCSWSVKIFPCWETSSIYLGRNNIHAFFLVNYYTEQLIIFINIKLCWNSTKTNCSKFFFDDKTNQDNLRGLGTSTFFLLENCCIIKTNKHLLITYSCYSKELWKKN